MKKRCEYKAKNGRCSRNARWTWQDDSMKIHHVCSQHRNKMMPVATMELDQPIPKCYGNITSITCRCDRYVCFFTKKDSLIRSPLVNKGKGICKKI